MMTSTTPSRRLFYALWPDDATRDSLMRLQAPLNGVKTPFANLHLTLAFLGQQPEAVLPALKNILVGLPQTPITLVVNRIGYFTKNKIAWAGMHETPPALSALQHHLINALIRNQITFNSDSEFRPHITLARAATPPEELPFTPATWCAGQVVLVESTTQNNGVAYHVLDSHSLHMRN